MLTNDVVSFKQPKPLSKMPNNYASMINHIPLLPVLALSPMLFLLWILEAEVEAQGMVFAGK